jgi:Arc/MetJ-type ribon-helix-helix transcriptional regulator
MAMPFLISPKRVTAELLLSCQKKNHFDITSDVFLLTMPTSSDTLSRCLFSSPQKKESAMSKNKRVVFSFDERSLESLQKLTEQGRFSSMADTVRESLQISRALQSQAGQGFTEVMVRNPETNEERVLVIPTLQPSSAKSEG